MSTRKNKSSAYNSFLICITLLIFPSCEKLVDVDSPPSLTGANVYDNDLTASAVLTGTYTAISRQTLSTPDNFVSISKLAGLSSDELTLQNASSLQQLAYYSNKLSSTANFSFGGEVWNSIYSLLFNCNAAIKGLSSSEKLTPSIKRQLLGEAKFVRSFFYFYLVNLYGDVPLVLNTDYEATRLLSRNSKLEIYEFIIKELVEAKGLLSPDFLDGALQKYSGAPERVRPTSWVASALLARIYLYVRNWSKAEAEASIVINQSGLFTLPELSKVFLKNSQEAIWQLSPVNRNRNTAIGENFILTASGFNSLRNVSISDNLVNSFEIGDQRLKDWMKIYSNSTGIYYYPFKYKANIVPANTSPTEYLMVFRLGEQYLIRAEARAKLGNLIGSQEDINSLRVRAGLNGTLASDETELIAAIEHERRVELFTEWGDRWLDLKRTGRVDEIMTITTPLKGGIWNTNQQLYPLPLTDIEKNINLIQNPGY